MKASSKAKAAAPAPTPAEIVEVLKNLLDPELGLDIYTLGFVRKMDLDAAKKSLRLKMTLTSPLCPYGPMMVRELQERLRRFGLEKVEIGFEFDPPWEPSAEVRLMLGV